MMFDVCCVLFVVCRVEVLFLCCAPGLWSLRLSFCGLVECLYVYGVAVLLFCCVLVLLYCCFGVWCLLSVACYVLVVD